MVGSFRRLRANAWLYRATGLFRIVDEDLTGYWNSRKQTEKSCVSVSEVVNILVCKISFCMVTLNGMMLQRVHTSARLFIRERVCPKILQVLALFSNHFTCTLLLEI